MAICRAITWRNVDLSSVSPYGVTRSQEINRTSSFPRNKLPDVFFLITSHYTDDILVMASETQSNQAFEFAQELL